MFSKLPDNNNMAELDYNNRKNAAAFSRHCVFLALWPDL
jgi:hypothetical protein